MPLGALTISVIELKANLLSFVDFFPIVGKGEEEREGGGEDIG